MTDSPITPKLRKVADFLMKRLWPNFTFPPYDMYFDDHQKNQGSMMCGKRHGIMRLAQDLAFRDFEDTVSTIGHEACHWYVHLSYEVPNGVDDGEHGPTWRAEMKRIGLPVPSNTTRETVERGGLFWIAYQEILAMEFAPEMASTAATAAATAAPGSSPRSGMPLVLPSTPAPTRGAQADQPWSFRSAFSQLAGRPPAEPAPTRATRAPDAPQSAPQVSTFLPRDPVIEGPRGTSSGHNLIFADCSWSMLHVLMGQDYIFEVQRRAVKHLLSNASGKCSLYGYAGNVWKASNPEELVCDDASTGCNQTYGIVSGTSFVNVFRQAKHQQDNYKEGDHIHLFSDGSPQSETISSVFDHWGMTTGDVSTYFIGNPNDTHAIQLMKELARGRGAAHVVGSEAELINAIRNEIGAAPMPFSVAPRPVRDWEPEKQRTVQYAAEIVKNQAHIIDIATTVGNAVHQIAEVKEEVRFLTAAQDMAHEAYRHSNQALDVLSSQRDVDRQQYELTARQNDAWVEGASQEFSRQSALHIGNALEVGALRSVSMRQEPARRLTLTSLDSGTVSRVAALMAGKGGNALPAPAASNAPALPSPAMANTLALPSPERAGSRELSLWGTPQRVAEPIKR